jgi:hypothetical protein
LRLAGEDKGQEVAGVLLEARATADFIECRRRQSMYVIDDQDGADSLVAG